MTDNHQWSFCHFGYFGYFELQGVTGTSSLAIVSRSVGSFTTRYQYYCLLLYQVLIHSLTHSFLSFSQTGILFTMVHMERSDFMYNVHAVQILTIIQIAKQQLIRTLSDRMNQSHALSGIFRDVDASKNTCRKN